MADAYRPTRSPQPSRGGIPPLLPAIAIPALLSLLGWISSYLYNMFNSDVTMPDWTVGDLREIMNIKALNTMEEERK